MGLLGEVQAAQAGHRKGTPCAIRVAMEALAGQDRKDFTAALEDPAIMASVLARVMQARGVRVPQESIQRHRRGACGCHR